MGLVDILVRELRNLTRMEAEIKDSLWLRGESKEYLWVG